MYVRVYVCIFMYVLCMLLFMYVCLYLYVCIDVISFNYRTIYLLCGVQTSLCCVFCSTALKVMSSAFSSKTLTYPLSSLADLLLFDSETEVAQQCKASGLTLPNENQVCFSRTNFHSPTETVGLILSFILIIFKVIRGATLANNGSAFMLIFRGGVRWPCGKRASPRTKEIRVQFSDRAERFGYFCCTSLHECRG